MWTVPLYRADRMVEVPEGNQTDTPRRHPDDALADFSKLCADQSLAEHLRDPAFTFSENVNTTINLVVYPIALLMQGVNAQERLLATAKAMVKTGAYRNWSSSEARREVHDELRKQSDREVPAEAKKQENARLNELWEQMHAIDEVESGSLALRQSVIVRSWTVLEALAGDLWVSALDGLPLPAQHRATVESLTAQDAVELPGLRGKQISVGKLFEYGLDFRGRLGSLLKGKCDFSSVRGIERAYRYLLSTEVELPHGEKLHELEAARHVLVHRAGHVDQEYLMRVGRSAQLGDILDFGAEELDEFLVTVIDAGVFLLRRVVEFHERCTANPKPSQ